MVTVYTVIDVGQWERFSKLASGRRVTGKERGLTSCASYEAKALGVKPPVATDAQSGISLYLNDNAQILSAHSKDGKPLWSVDVIEKCGIPFVGEPKVRNVTIQDGKANVVFGMHDFASVDLKSGEFEYLGAD